MRFEKWQALGNDYIVVEAAALPWELTAERIRRICAPHFADGSEAELSGNGAREAVLYLRSAGWTREDSFSVLTKAGPVTPRIIDSRTVAMAIGRASTTSPDYPGGP